MLIIHKNAPRVKGTKWITPERLVDRVKGFNFAYKRDNIIGLQVADLIAYPIGRQVLNPERPYPAFKVIAKNIYTYKGA